MPITHHPPDDTVLRYANGTLPEAPAIVVATHLSFCPACRQRMETYEMLGGSLLEDAAPSKLSADALSITLARLDALSVGGGSSGDGGNSGDRGDGGDRGNRDDGGNGGNGRDGGNGDDRGNGGDGNGRKAGNGGGRGPNHGERLSVRQRPDLPSGMDWPQCLRHYDIPGWRFVLPGVKWTGVSLTGPEAGQLLLVRGVAGAKLPSHGHDGTEYTCVLTGAFSDSNGTYTVGDLLEASEDHDHQPIVTPDAECVCLIAIEGHLRLHGIARLLQPFLGL